MKEIRLRYIREYRGVGITAPAKERITRVGDSVLIRWTTTFRKLLEKGIWCNQISEMLGIGLIAPCKAHNCATLILEQYHEDKVDKYEVYHDENKVLVYHNNKLIRELHHAIRTV